MPSGQLGDRSVIKAEKFRISDTSVPNSNSRCGCTKLYAAGASVASSSPRNMEAFTDKWLKPRFLLGTADCMFTTISCGTNKCFPQSLGGKFAIGEDGVLRPTANVFCFCLRPSPIPCFMGCGVGPCRWTVNFKKESETKWIGTGESQLAGGCCVPCCHNRGDTLEIVGEELIISAGKSPAYPPCWHNKKVVALSVAPWNKFTSSTTGAPEAGEMAR